MTSLVNLGVNATSNELFDMGNLDAELLKVMDTEANKEGIELTLDDFRRFIKGSRRLCIEDPLSYLPQYTTNHLTNVSSLLRTLENDLFQIKRISPEKLTDKEIIEKEILKQHFALMRSLKAIKHRHYRVREEFNKILERMGWYGGFDKNAKLNIFHPVIKRLHIAL